MTTRSSPKADQAGLQSGDGERAGDPLFDPAPERDALAAARDALAVARREIQDLSASLASSRTREQVLRQELQHRVRNLLGVIRSIYRRTLDSEANPDGFARHFAGRLNVIARYHTYLSDFTAGTFDLEDMLRDEILATGCLDGPRCSIEGPSVALSEKVAELMGLAIHELTTNSIEFGALGRKGRLQIKWSIDRDGCEHRLNFHWLESGVPIAAPAPVPVGFGRELIEDALRYQLGATTSLELRPGGMMCTILLPLPTGSPADPFENSQSDEPPMLLPESE